MTNGWRQYASLGNSSLYANLTVNNTYSNGGATVGKDVGSIRNRDNIQGRLMCVGQPWPFGPDLVWGTANFYNQQWVNVSANRTRIEQFWRGPSSSDCY
jgi:hypothetical protein